MVPSICKQSNKTGLTCFMWSAGCCLPPSLLLMESWKLLLAVLGSTLHGQAFSSLLETGISIWWTPVTYSEVEFLKPTLQCDCSASYIGFHAVFLSTGREQASLTGQRLALLASEGNNFSCIINSSLTRFTETADIISKNLPDIKMCSSSLLHEGPPTQPVPAESKWIPDLSYFKDGPRIEAAFRKYIHRADPEQTKDSYEIKVCHDNVIRYFVCRALKLPPEAWLRLSLYHGSITKLVIKPDGDVSLKMLGDAGFMPPGKLTRA
ncbi:serine/threonine-protein phosphatase PGAM5, mitochondrial-like [Pelobates fuscus]|uniref:serine/threonine-protein phosphatase PGAM5, mitochondrial-like n=1 Tax=Pelobates fuscus TaxID=191477 RepID=UPI002FE48733